MPHRRRTAPVAALALAAALLSGCTSSPVGETYTVPPKTTAPSTAAAPRPTPTTPPPTQDTATATRVTITCGKLVPTKTATALAAGYARTADYSPTPGTNPARIANLKGRVCGWTDAATGHTLEVAVGDPSASDLLALKNDLVERSNAVPTYGEEAYFAAAKGVGEVDAFHGKYWVVARSADFFEPGDATAVITAVNKALKKS